MKSLTLTILVTLLFSLSCLADNGLGLAENYGIGKGRRSTFDKSKILVGGGLGGGSLQGGFIFNVTPSIGYAFTDRFHAGINLGYFYSQQEIPYTGGSYEKFKNRVLSSSLYARVFPLDVIFLQVMPELNFVTTKYEYYYALNNDLQKETRHTTIPAFLVGGGYAQRLGGNSYMMISVMYDIVQNPNSPYYRQPVFGGGLALGLFGN